jgi:L-aminopeptidase/D-esterase-like protein
MPKLNNTITDVPGIKVGQHQNLDALTGCTVILCEDGATGGVDQRGGAPGTRETDLLRPIHLVNHVHAVLLAGGSAFGLDAATGVMKYLEENNIGIDTGAAKVPIVPSAILFDLAIGDPSIRPDAQMGYQACQLASSAPVLQGNFGAGTGATAGKIYGPGQAMKTGIGSASMDLGAGVIVGAIIAVNPFGDVINPQTGEIVAGTRPLLHPLKKTDSELIFADTLNIMKSFTGRKIMNFAMKSNTVIGVVATNAKLNKEEANKVAQMAQNGIAITTKPANTMLDGDTIIALSTNKKKADVNIVGAFAAEVVAQAILNGVRNAEPAGGLPSAQNYP